MSHSLSATVNDEHPLALELSSLRAAVSRYQHEAHATSLKLQRHSLEASQALDHARALERENTRLREEVAVLRANPDHRPTDASFQVPELTLALRRLSDKLTAVEETLLTRTKEFADVCSELASAQHEVEAARALAAEASAREEQALAREREQERKVRVAEEERRMADLVVQEYADLVRKLEGRAKVSSAPPSATSMDLSRSTNGSATTLVDSLTEGRLGLQRLLEEFNGRNERLQAEIAKLHGDNGLLYKELEVVRQGANHDRAELAKAIHQLDKYRADDNTAAKMVSRYMKFSQSSTDTLQKAIETRKLRHAATIATLNAEISQLQRAVSQEHDETERLRNVLDELTEDIAREAYGRRREVSLRLAFLGREENLAESLRRWVRKAKEALERSAGTEDEFKSSNSMALREAYAKAMNDAEVLLDTLNWQPSAGSDGDYAGVIARLVLAQDTVATLSQELQEETVRRLKTERQLVGLESVDHAEGMREIDGSQPIVHPVPHRISETHQERHMLDASVPTTTSTVNAPAAATPQDVAAAPASSSSEIVATVEVETVPALQDSMSVEPGSSPIPTTLDEALPSTASEAPPADTEATAKMLDLEVSEASTLPLATAKAAGPTLGDSNIPFNPVTISTVDGDIPSHGSIPIPFPSVVVADAPSVIPAPSSSPIPFPPVEKESSSTVPTKSQEVSRALKSHIPPPLPLEAANGSTLSSFSPGPSSDSLPTSESKQVLLLGSLARIKYRYDDVQRGFRGCHIALKGLKKGLASLPSLSSGSAPNLPSVLHNAVDRLTDFNEDARVELEIRIADEERLASGYEALLSIPEAMSDSDDTDSVDSDEMFKEVRAFIDGSDRIVAKATQQFTQKLDDLEHDIASIKRTLHKLSLSSEESPLAPSDGRFAKSTASPSWSAWTPSFLSPVPRSTSPAPPTFGSVMTSPRLRHSSSFSHPRDRSTHDPGSSLDLLASLGLRIVVPARSPTYGSGLSAGPNGGPRSGPRQRTTSGMFMLGLGVRSASFGPSMGRPGLQKVPSRSSLASSSTTRLASTLSTSSDSPVPQKKVVPEQRGQENGDVNSDVE